MKNFKRSLSLLLSLVLILSGISTVALAEGIPAAPLATVTELQNEDMTFAVNFLNAAPTNEQSAYYGNWHADYEITFSKPVTLGTDVTLSIRNEQIGAMEWTSAPMDGTLPAGQSLNVVEYIFTLSSGVPYSPTFYDIRDAFSAPDFGVKFSDEFLAANPYVMTTIALKLYNPETNEAVVLAQYINGIPEMPSAKVFPIMKDGMTFAMNFLMVQPTDEQLAYYGNWFADFELTVNKDVTFDANGTGDGWLAGQYDAWSKDWINAPIKPVALKAGEPLKIMETAAGLLGEPGLKLTYKDVYESVKDFDCGIFLDEEFLLANPDVEVKLELKMYSPDGTKSSVIGETLVFTYNPETPERPTATVSEIENDDLTFAMNFKVDNATLAQLAYYGKWYADFELTVNKTVTFNNDGSADGWLSGQYDAWSENWVTVPFGKFAPVTLEANQPLKIMAFAAELMDEPGLKYTFKEVYETVKDFDCGVFFSPEFLMANPDLEVKLELKMYNPADETEGYIIGETYIFKNEFVAYNTVTEKLYTELATATLECGENETVILLKDVSESIIYVLENTTLDLNGYTLTTNYMSSYGDLIDGSDDNSGLLNVASTRFLIQKNNSQIPVRDGNGYRFMEIIKIQSAMQTATKFAFLPRFEPGMLELLKQGSEATGVTIHVLVSWKQGDGYRTQDFVYTDNFVNDFLNSYKPATDKYGKMFTLSLNGAESFTELSFTVQIVSEQGVFYPVIN